MIAGIVCTVVIAAIALYQTLAVRQDREAAAIYRVSKFRLEALCDGQKRQLGELAAAMERMHDAMVRDDSAALLAAILDARRAVGREVAPASGAVTS